MSYNRSAIPRAYMDRVSHDLVTGWRVIGDHDLEDPQPTSGSLGDLFDMRPTNFVTWATNSHPITIIIDTGFSSGTNSEANFLAILGHNLNYAGAKFSLASCSVSAFNSSVNSITDDSETEIVNATHEGGYIKPGYNGWSLITWPEPTANNRFYRLIINPVSTNFSYPVKIGNVLLGEYIDFPHSPNANLKFSVDYEGSKILTSAGGQSFSSASYLGSPPWAVTNPWILATYQSETASYEISRHMGRRRWNMDFSYINDTDLFMSNMRGAAGDVIDGSDLYSQFYNKALGEHQPFLFTNNGSAAGAGAESGFGLYRLASGNIESTQVTPNTWNSSFSFVEHW